MTFRFLNGWNSGDTFYFTLFGVWYYGPQTFGYRQFGIVVCNFGVNISLLGERK
jgi:hypothetical protein